MPEGPEVARISEALNRHCQGKHLISITILPTSRYHAKSGFKGQSLLTCGLVLKSVASRGKKIIFNFEDSIIGAQIYMISFLGMEGHWVLNPTKHTSVVLQFGHINSLKNGRRLAVYEKTLYYEDSRHFGTFEVFDNLDDLEKAFKSIGPDLLHESITFDHYHQVIATRALQDKQIAWFLLEQKYFSGIGNYLRSEILYLSRIAPHRVIGTLSLQEIQTLHSISMSVIREAYVHNGLTLSSYVDPDGNGGTYEPHVYKKTHDKCGNPVERCTGKEGRTVHWVRNVQS